MSLGRAPTTFPRGRAWLPFAVLAVAGALPVLVLSAMSHDPEPRRRPIDGPAASQSRYASQTWSRELARAAHVRWARREHEDSAAEACEARTVRGWARLYGADPTKRAVARAFAKHNYEPALQPAAEDGCLKGLAEAAP